MLMKDVALACVSLVGKNSRGLFHVPSSSPLQLWLHFLVERGAPIGQRHRRIRLFATILWD